MTKLSNVWVLGIAKESMNLSKKIKIKLLKLESIENGNLLKIMLDSNNALSLNFEQEKNLSDELAMGKELEEDDQDVLKENEAEDFDKNKYIRRSF